MKERPIIFSSDMVKAVLDGHKTQTRRIIKIPEGIAAKYEYKGNDGGNKFLPKESGHCWKNGYAMWRPKLCPYGVVGDRLWVRETWDFRPMGGVLAANRIAIVGYKADAATKAVDVPENCNPTCHKKWRSPIHMFQWAARIWLEITGIRVERVQEISEADTKAEGVIIRNIGETYWRAFHNLWDSLNVKRGYGWDKNPWVWVIEFKRVRDKI